MSDDVKAARESIKEFRAWAQRLNQLARYSEDGMTHSLIAADNQRAIEVKTKALLAHIDGEPARIAAACEEVREAVARHVMGPALKRDPDLFADHLEEVYAATIRRMPLTATPLADEIAALRARVAELEHQREGMLMGGVTTEARQQLERAEKAEAERDALRARVFEVEQRQVGYVLVSFASHEQWKAELAELGALRARLDALYGVILFAHAFAEAEPLVSGYVRLHGHILHLREIHALARAATQAMDEAKP